MEIWHLWIIGGIVLLIIEIFTPGFLFASFGVASFACGLVSYFGISFKYQLLIFSIVTLVVFFGIRPIFKKHLARFDDEKKIGIEALAEKECKVIDAIINKEQKGRIQIGDESWRAFSIDGNDIEVGKIVKIIKIVGVTAHVSKIKED